MRLALALLLLALGAVQAQEATTDFADIALPVAAHAIEIEGGRKTDYVAGRPSETFYRIAYHGVPLKFKGTPTQYADTIVLDKPRLDATAADRSDLTLRLEDGTLAAGGGLIDMGGAMPITLAGLQKLDLRGAAFLAADKDFKQVQFAVGLESPPLRIPGMTGLGVSNWAVFGLNAQRREQTDAAAGDASFATATYRVFLGKAFFWRTRPEAAVRALAQRIEDAYLRAAPTLAAAETVSEDIQKIDAKSRSPLQTLFKDAVTTARAQGDWPARAKEFARGAAEAMSQQPTLALYAEGSGWYEFRGREGVPRYRHLFTVTADYWFMPFRDDVFLRLRYENGYERGAPEQRKKQLLASIALRY